MGGLTVALVDGSRRRTVGALVAAAVLASTVIVLGLGTGGGGGAGPSTTLPDDADVTVTVTTEAPETGDLRVPDAPDTFAVAVPSLGFGVAVPDAWQATLLSTDALERLRTANLEEPFFLDAATNVAATGALFYAAGIDVEGRVAELKIDVQEDADTSPGALRELADLVVAAAGVDDAAVTEVDGGRVRIDFTLTQPAADDGEPIDALTTQLLVPDGDRLWSLIVTSEEPATQDALVDLFLETFVLD